MNLKLEELLKRFRSPDKLLSVLIEDLEGRIEEARSACSLVVADMRRLRCEIASHEKAGEEAHAAAERALEQDHEDPARAALARKIAHREEAAGLKAELDQLEKESDKLARELEHLVQVADEARRKRNLSRARKKVSGSKAPRRARKVTTGEPVADEAAGTGLFLDAEIERAFEELEKKDMLERELKRLKKEKKTRK